jgi:Type IV secretion-system coupling protein DNA-binding domain
VEIERLRESRTEGHFPHNRRNSRNYQLDCQTEPLVMPSEIAGLPDLHGYLKSGNLVVPLSFPYIELPQKQPSFLARENTVRIIEIGKRPSQPSNPREPEKSSGIAAGQEPYFQ